MSIRFVSFFNNFVTGVKVNASAVSGKDKLFSKSVIIENITKRDSWKLIISGKKHDNATLMRDFPYAYDDYNKAIIDIQEELKKGKPEDKLLAFRALSIHLNSHPSNNMLLDNKARVHLFYLTSAIEFGSKQDIATAISNYLNLGKDIQNTVILRNNNWFMELRRQIIKKNLYKNSPEIITALKKGVDVYGSDSFFGLSFRVNLFEIGQPWGKDNKNSLIVIIKSKKTGASAEKKDMLLSNLLEKEIQNNVKTHKYNEALVYAKEFIVQNKYWVNFVNMNRYEYTKDKSLLSGLQKYANSVKPISVSKKQTEAFYLQVRENYLAANIYKQLGNYDTSLTKLNLIQEKISKTDDSELWRAVQISRADVFAGWYEADGNIQNKTSYETVVKNTELSELTTDQKTSLFWTAVKISKRDKNTIEIEKMEKSLKLTETKDLSEKALLAEIVLIKADINFDNNKNDLAEKAIKQSISLLNELIAANYYQQDTALEMRNKIDNRQITLSLRKGDFNTAQLLLEKKLGLTAGYTPLALENIRKNSKNPQTVDLLLSLAQIVLLNRETKGKIIGQNEKINIMTSFLAKNETIFSTDKDKLRYITFKISKQNFDYNFNKEFKEDKLKLLVAEGNKTADRLSQRKEEYKDGVLVEYYQSVSRGYYQVANKDATRQEEFLDEAALFNDKASKAQGKNKRSEVIELSEKIAMRKFANKSFFDKLQLTKSTMTMNSEVKENIVSKREEYIDKYDSREVAENTEASQTALQTYSFNLEAGYPFSSNFFMFGRMGIDLVSGNQQIEKQGEQFIYDEDFDMRLKDNVQDSEIRNIDLQFKSIELGLRPYYKGIMDNKYLSTDVFADVSGRYEKLFPGMQDQKALGVDYFSHSLTLGGGTYNKIYPFADFRDLIHLNIDAEYYQRWQFNQKLPQTEYKGTTYDAANDAAVDNNIYDSDTKNPSSYYFNSKIGLNYSGSTFFGGIAGGVQSYKEGYYDSMSLENKRITNPYIESYIGTSLPYDMKVSLGYSYKFGENSGNNYSAEVSKGNFFIKGSWFNASKSSSNYNSTATNPDGSTGIFNGQGKDKTKRYGLEGGVKQPFN